MTKAISTAERVSALFDGDGLCWELGDGRTLGDVCHEQGAKSVDNARGVRWTFPDNSAIVESTNAWDLGFPGLDDCYCWLGVAIDYPERGGHNETCPHAYSGNPC